MTLASHRSLPTPSDGDSTADGHPVSDFHLVEDAEGWRLRINATARLRELLDAADAGAGDGAVPAAFTVHVEPNLLPGEPFEVTIQPLRAES